VTLMSPEDMFDAEVKEVKAKRPGGVVKRERAALKARKWARKRQRQARKVNRRR
jgi:hypothetical protein